ncbi:MAG: SGNH/GDSL hydrolase family protein [Deltaproteobacteria bacterium]|nr:SGNH/GDSL hydrolase family protein [Deltaproteobacteria bacterium]
MRDAATIPTRPRLVLASALLSSALAVTASSACRSSPPPPPVDSASRPIEGRYGVVGIEGIRGFDGLSAAQREQLKQRRIFWGHQSVGANVMDGTKALGFPFAQVRSGSDFETVRWGEAAVAENGDPERKIRSFDAFIAGRGMGARVEAASFKFCWIDFEDTTDVTALLNRYDAQIRRTQERNPNLRILHVTPPLTTDEPELNAIRWRYGRDLITRYSEDGLVFDLAELMATQANGAFCWADGAPRLCDEWAPEGDNGHLNARGSQRAGKAFLHAFWRLFSS